MVTCKGCRCRHFVLQLFHLLRELNVLSVGRVQLVSQRSDFKSHGNHLSLTQHQNKALTDAAPESSADRRSTRIKSQIALSRRLQLPVCLHSCMSSCLYVCLSGCLSLSEARGVGRGASLLPSTQYQLKTCSQTGRQADSI